MQDNNIDSKAGDKQTDNRNNDGCVGCGCNDSQVFKKQETFTNNESRYQVRQRKQEEEDQTGSFRALIIIGLTLTIALVIIEIFVDTDSSQAIDYVLLSLATPVQAILGRPFYLRFYNSLRRKRRFTVDMLVVLSTSVAFAYSVIAIFTDQYVRFFEASASVLTIFTIDEYLEARVLRTTSESLEKLIALKPKTATVIRIRTDGKQEEQEVNVDDIVIGDIVIVKPGETVSTDGIIIYGESSMDESMITGESIPVDKKPGDQVIGGTINKHGYLRIKAVNVGSQTVLANIVEMVKRARSSKPSIQRIADTAAMYFIPIVLLIAVGASIYWTLFAHASVQFIITVFATILVVSCPCALGIATPMVVSLGVGKAAREGVLIKGGEYLEKLAHIDTVVFDKTGTLTKGEHEVTDIIANDNYDELTVLQIAYSTEIKSEHPIAQDIVSKAKEWNIQTLEVTQFNAISGHGITAKYLDKTVFVGSPRTWNREKVEEELSSINNHNHTKQVSTIMQSLISELETEGKTVVAVFLESSLVGLIAVADTLRCDAGQTVQEIKSMGKQVVLLTGDNVRTAKSIAKKLGIDTVIAEVTPAQKSAEIVNLQIKHKKRVTMVGDGINDAPALTQADVGIAMGAGTDIAVSAGNVILIKNDLADVIYAFKIGDYSLKKIKQNLLISFVYNSITIPLAAGILYSLTNSLVLTPSLAALGWIISDSAVFGNSMLVKRYNKKK